MITTTVRELLEVQAKQLDHYCEHLAEDAAAELRRRIKEKTAHYPRPEMEIEVAYAQIPRGGNIEVERARVLAEYHPIFGFPPRGATKEEGMAAHKKLQPFMNESQWKCVGLLIRDGEEAQFFRDKMVELAGVIEKMPKTYETQRKDAPEPVAHLHYFVGSADWFIIELDKGTKTDAPEDFMRQCFGYANLFSGDPGTGELGYISLPEILKNGAELDFHWTPKTVAQCQRHNEPDDEHEREVRGIEGSHE